LIFISRASKSAVSFSVTSAVISHYEITPASGCRNSLSPFYGISDIPL